MNLTGPSHRIDIRPEAVAAQRTRLRQRQVDLLFGHLAPLQPDKLKELQSLGMDQFAGYLQHDNKEETLRVYGETVIPALSDHLSAKS